MLEQQRGRSLALRTWMAAGLLAAGGAAFATDKATTTWRDPLDTPAKQSARAVSTQLLSVARAGARLVAVGWRGHIVVSDDEGASWRQVPSPVSVDLTAVSFPSPDAGWAVGHGGVILHSQDGGLTWAVQVDGRTTAREMVAFYEKLRADGVPDAARLLEDVQLNTKSGAEQPWLDVHFTDESNGWVAGSFGMFMGTADGGRKWAPLQHKIDNPNSFHLTAIASLNGDVYIASEQGTVFRKDRASDRFTPRATGYKGTFFGLVAHKDALIAYGLRGTAYRSTDRGMTWVAMKTGTASAITAGAIFPDGRTVLATQAGELLVAQPGSLEFNHQKPSRGFLFSGLTSSKSGAAVIVGTGGAMVRPLDSHNP